VERADGAPELLPGADAFVPDAVPGIASVRGIADWCLSCKFNERTVLASEAVQSVLARPGPG